MTKYSLSELEIQAPVANHLKSYFQRLHNFNNLDLHMPITIWVNEFNRDFVAFEADEYQLGFQNTRYKISSILNLSMAYIPTYLDVFEFYVNENF